MNAFVKATLCLVSLSADMGRASTPVCAPRARGHYSAPTYAASYSYVAPLVTYYPPQVPANYNVSYSQSFGISSEAGEIIKLLIERDAAREQRDAAREIKYDALLQRLIEGSGAIPAKIAPRHPGLIALVNKCSSCHADGMKKGEITFLRGGTFLDVENNVNRVLRAIDPYGPTAKGGRAHMPPEKHEPLTIEETMAATSYLNWLTPKEGPPKKAEMPPAPPF